MSQIVDNLSDIVFSRNHVTPTFIRVVSPRETTMIVGGTAGESTVMNEYIRLSALPQELRERVIAAIKAQIGW